LGAAEPRYVLQSPGLVENCVRLYVPLLEFNQLGKRHFSGVRPEPGAAHPAQTVLFATNYEPVKMKVAPIEYDLEQVGQRGDAAAQDRLLPVFEPPVFPGLPNEPAWASIRMGALAGCPHTPHPAFETGYICKMWLPMNPKI